MKRKQRYTETEISYEVDPSLIKLPKLKAKSEIATLLKSTSELWVREIFSLMLTKWVTLVKNISIQKTGFPANSGKPVYIDYVSIEFYVKHPLQDLKSS